VEWGNDFEDKARRVVGDEKEIKLGEDKWVDNESLKQKFPRLFSVSLDVGHTLSQVGAWNDNYWSWKLGWRRTLFVWESSQADQLSQLLDNKRLAKEGESMTNKWIWRDTMSTVYTVKATYNHLKGVEQGGVGDFLAKFQKLKTLPSMQVTTWRVLTNIVATKDNILRHDLVLVSNLCPLCGEEVETVNHLC